MRKKNLNIKSLVKDFNFCVQFYFRNMIVPFKYNAFTIVYSKRFFELYYVKNLYVFKTVILSRVKTHGLKILVVLL